MKRLLKIFFKALKVSGDYSRLTPFLLLLFITVISRGQNSFNIVPMPAGDNLLKGPPFILNNKTVIYYNSSELSKDVTWLQQQLTLQYGLTVKSIYDNKKSHIKINYSNSNIFIEMGPKGWQSGKGEAYYNIYAVSNSMIITVQRPQGFFYSIQTMLQCIRPVTAKNSTKEYEIPAMNFSDYPRFAYRGMHLDVSRHFFPVAQIKKYIDYLAAYKFNTFHWHLTDDQGWRIEIKKYPKLTSVGGYRNGTIIGSYPGTGNDSVRYGGFYSQEQIKEVVKYAADRYIDIIPEIEMPGHSAAAIAAYPQLSCFPDEPDAIPSNTAWAGSRNGKQVQQSWGVFEDVLCPSEYTFKFLEDVLDEVMQLFPSKYIHIGGDEAPKSSWKRSAFCQQLIRGEKLKDENQLQDYFTGRIEKYINSKGKKIIGWDEILEGNLAANVTVMSWRGEAGGIAAAKLDHDVIMAPENPLYLNHSQSKNEDSLTQGGYNPIENVYNYEPVPKELNEEQAKHILGAQGNMWSEYLENEKKLEYMLFPRLTALSEVLWSPKEKRNWKDFERRLPVTLQKLDSQKINYSKAYYDLKATVLPTENYDGVLWKLETKVNKPVMINFDRTDSVWVYTRPQLIKSNTTVYADQEINKNSRVSISAHFNFNKATGKKITLATPPSDAYPGDGAFTLVNGIQNEKGFTKSTEFLGFSGKDLDATIDLAEETNVSKIIIHVLDQSASWIYLPSSVEVTYLHTDKINDETKMNAPFVTKVIDPLKQMGSRTITVDSKQRCRYVHIVVKNMGLISVGYPGSGNAAWLFVDEIEIK